MIRTCWFACLLSLAVSTQTVWGQPAYAPPAGNPPAPVDPAVQLRTQLEAYLRQLQSMSGPGCGSCPASECTRPQYGPPCGQPTVNQEQLKALIESAVRDAVQQQTFAKPDCCEDPTTNGNEQPVWFWKLEDFTKSWLHAWQKISCLMTQTAQSSCHGQSDGECPFAPCSGAEAKNTFKVTIRTVGHLNDCAFSDRTIIRVINATDSKFQLTPEAVRWLKEQGISDRVIVHMALRCEPSTGCDNCPFAQAFKTCTRPLCSAETMVRLVKAIESCCAPAFQTETCCQERATPAGCPTQTCPACPACPACPNVGICPFAQLNVADAPNCCRATADKGGCCAHCNCKTCGKCKSVNQDPWDAFWSCYQETVSKLLGCPSLNFARQPSCPGTCGEVPAPHEPYNGSCPYCPTIGTPGCGKCPVMGPTACGLPPYCPTIGTPGCGQCPVMGPTPPAPCGLPQMNCMPSPCPANTCPAQQCPWLNGMPGGPFAGMMPPPCPWMGSCPPAVHCPPMPGMFPGAVPPGGMPPWGTMPGGQWPMPNPNCMMPGAGNPWGPYVIYHEVPNPEARTPLQPVAMLPQADVGCQDECKIVAGNGAVHFTTSCIDARCSTVTAGNRERIVLEGKVRLVCKKGGETTCIEAPRIVVNLNQGTFTVEAGTSAAPANACPVNLQDVLKCWSCFPY